jgi:hypothetical protein
MEVSGQYNAEAISYTVNLDMNHSETMKCKSDGSEFSSSELWLITRK